MRGSSSLLVRDAEVEVFGATGPSSTIEMPSANQSLKVSASELENSGSGSGTLVVLGSAGTARVQISDSTVAMTASGAGSAALAFTGSGGTLALDNTAVRSNQRAIAMSDGMVLTAHDAHLSTTSTGASLVVAAASSATTSRLYGGSLSAPAALGTVVDDSAPAVVRCYGVIDETAGGATSAMTTGTCP